MGKSPHTAGVSGPARLAELIVALSLAGDLGMGRQMGHAGRTAYLAVRLAAQVGLPERERAGALYVALLRGVGCVGDAHDMALEFLADDLLMKREFATAGYGRPSDQMRAMLRTTAVGAPLPVRAAVIIRAMGTAPRRVGEFLRAHCEVGSIIAQRLGLGAAVAEALRAIFERWDGSGSPDHRRGDEIPVLARLVHVAAFADTFGSAVGKERAIALVHEQAGRALDPLLAAEFEALDADEIWSTLDAPTFTADLLALEPEPTRSQAPDGMDEVLLAFADFADLKSPYTVGHSRGVAHLVEVACRALRLPADAVNDARRAALVHDIGRVAVPNTILDKRGRLNEAEWERVRLHPYYTERILARSAPLAGLALVASEHHERLDGSGYHRGARAPQLSPAARVLGAADALHAMLEERAHRLALSLPLAVQEIRDEVATGRMDPDAAECVIAAAGARQERREPPAVLTPRELDVLRLVARGRGNKEVAAALDLSEKTVGHHLEHAFEKLGVSTRSGAVMSALTRGLLDDLTIQP